MVKSSFEKLSCFGFKIKFIWKNIMATHGTLNIVRKVIISICLQGLKMNPQNWLSFLSNSYNSYNLMLLKCWQSSLTIWSNSYNSYNIMFFNLLTIFVSRNLQRHRPLFGRSRSHRNFHRSLQVDGKDRLWNGWRNHRCLQWGFPTQTRPLLHGIKINIAFTFFNESFTAFGLLTIKKKCWNIITKVIFLKNKK
jgi:hypothetical protein